MEVPRAYGPRDFHNPPSAHGITYNNVLCAANIQAFARNIRPHFPHSSSTPTFYTSTTFTVYNSKVTILQTLTSKNL